MRSLTQFYTEKDTSILSHTPEGELETVFGKQKVEIGVVP